MHPHTAFHDPLHKPRSSADEPAFDLPIWRESTAWFEWFGLRSSAVFSGRDVPHGAGTGVALIPGMLASDYTMHELASWLRRIGYAPYVSGIGRNVHCPETSLAEIVRTVDRAFDETGRRPVHVIGHSLGGLLARGAAILRPRQVKGIITLGSPVQGSRVHPFVRMAAEWIRECDGECLAGLQQPLPPTVGETNIYTRRDGIVDWRTCLRGDARAIAVSGTHCGLIVNAAAYEAIAGALAGTSRRALGPAKTRSSRRSRRSIAA